ncbi:hypothetical protein RvY_08081-2 [Ramazzottius varieornatus]|uniref:Uncharacterized protein n=1 Tax=Ramazzottius varieornatus TaxID=947166 RepID=A0A1D1V7B3_RAMVA|nr:hypothetical protein RvY_08081-2 [Ramazzottius varieornatus]
MASDRLHLFQRRGRAKSRASRRILSDQLAEDIHPFVRGQLFQRLLLRDCPCSERTEWRSEESYPKDGMDPYPASVMDSVLRLSCSKTRVGLNPRCLPVFSSRNYGSSFHHSCSQRIPISIEDISNCTSS